MIKKGHVEVARVGHRRDTAQYVETVNDTLNKAVGDDNVDWFVQNYYEAQCSYVIFTVPKHLEEKAQEALYDMRR